MSDPAPAVVAATAAAAQSLRDTAKWLVGGVVATAAGVFAGSSLTSLGSLDPTDDRQRLLLAIGSLLVGFVGLAIILVPAVLVLVRETKTFREIATPAQREKAEIVRLRAALLERYRSQLPPGIASFDAYVSRVDEAFAREPKAAGDSELIARAVANFAIFNADAGFLFVRNRFKTLLLLLAPGAVVAIVGFGLFAWAANPPPGKSAPPAFSLTIQGAAKP